MKNSFSVLRSVALLSSFRLIDASLPTWPSPVYDQLEYVMYQLSGYQQSGFQDGVTPCSFNSNGHGRITAAEWIRTAYHDMATATFSAGTGGLDASIAFELDRAENPGAAFNATLGFMNNYYNSRASMADLIALGVHIAVKSCGGPFVPYRAGRVDATEAGPSGVPEPTDDLATLTAKFAKAGFNTTDMIDMVACGHTLGGVHGEDFPTIVPPTANVSNNFSHFDSTYDSFDAQIATEYVSDNTTNPLVNGPDSTRNSDARVFGADGNVTMKELTDASVFQARCASILQRMIDTVPANVTLTPYIAPYEVKPSGLQLSVLAGGLNLSFDGEIRVRTNDNPLANISSVQLVYNDRSGNYGGVIETQQARYEEGEVTGFTDHFVFFDFSQVLSTSSSISSFNVTITHFDNTTETYDNNGSGFPVQDIVMLQSTGSCYNQTLDSNGEASLTILSAVRSTTTSPNLSLTLAVPRQGVIVAALQTTSLPMTKINTTGDYDFYGITTPVSLAQSIDSYYDIVAGENADEFKASGGLDSC